MDWYDGIRQKLRATLLSLSAILAPLGPSSDAHASELDISNTPSTNASAPRPASAVVRAIVELKCAVRILEAFAEHDSHPLQGYMGELEQIMASARVDGLSDMISVADLSTSLERARIAFEHDVESASDWCRLVGAIDPRLTSFKIPPRFIRIVTGDPEPLQPWSPETRRAWMANLDE